MTPTKPAAIAESNKIVRTEVGLFFVLAMFKP
jgi:hypothetical protein